MTFNLISKDKMKVVVSEYELACAGLTYKSLNAGDIATKEFMMQIVKRGNGEVGFIPSGRKLFIEIYPADKNFAKIYFTAIEPMGASISSVKKELSKDFEEELSFDSEIEVEETLDSLIDSLCSRHTRSVDIRFQDVPTSFVQDYLENKLCKFTVTAQGSGCVVHIEPNYE